MFSSAIYLTANGQLVGVLSRNARDRVEAETGALLLQRLEADGRGDLQVEDTD